MLGLGRRRRVRDRRRDDRAVAATRAGGPPIVIAPAAVLGTAFPESLRRVLDVPAYWLVYLPVEFAAFYPAGLVGLFFLLKDRSLDGPDQQTIRPLALLAAVSLVAAWLLRSVVAETMQAVRTAMRFEG